LDLAPRSPLLLDLPTPSSWPILPTEAQWLACTTTSGGWATSSLAGQPTVPTRTSQTRGRGGSQLWYNASSQDSSCAASCSFQKPPGTYSLSPLIILYANLTCRWLLAKDRREEAIAIMAKYHGDGDENHPLVQLQLREITEDFSVTRNDNPWWDFRELYNTKAARYRIMMVIAMAFFGQWSGKQHH
jgi:hypothetical protein